MRKIYATLAIVSMYNSPEQDIKQQISRINQTLSSLYLIKYYILLYGPEPNQTIDTKVISELDGKVFAEILSKKISLRKLATKFPRFSMLVDSKKKTSSDKNILLKTVFDLIEVVQWNLNLCKALWMPTERNEVVHKIDHSLDLRTNGYSSEELEKALNEQIEEANKLLESLGDTLSNKSNQWASEFRLFYKFWHSLEGLIQKYRKEYTDLVEQIKLPETQDVKPAETKTQTEAIQTNEVIK